MNIHDGKVTFSEREAALAVLIAVVLTSVVFTIIGNTSARERDAARLGDMKEIRQALRLYKVNTGRFPVAEQPVIITGTDVFSKALLEDLLVSRVFTDPIHPDFMYTYQSDPAGREYNLRFCLETDTVANYTKGCDNILTP